MEKELAVKDKDKYELLKHSSTIHITNLLSITERKIYNILLKNAYKELKDNKVHKIRISELKNLIGRETRYATDLKKAIKNLVETSVEWNILGKDNKNEWGITTFLASAVFAKGFCSYDYSLSLKEFLANPNIYARLNILVQKEFNNRHALVLWEFLHEQLCVSNKNLVTTKNILLEDIKIILGLTNTYADFRVFNRDVLKKAIKEINDLSDINVSISFFKEGKKVRAASFTIVRKEYQKDNELLSSEYIYNNDNSIIDNIEKEIINKNVEKHKHLREAHQINFQEKDKIKNNKNTNNLDKIEEDIKQTLLEEFKISEVKAEKLIAEFKRENIEKSLSYVRDKISSGFKIANIGAYSTKAIKEGWMQTETVDFKKEKSKEELMTEAEEELEKLEDEIKTEAWYTVWMEMRSQIDIFEFRNWIAHLKYEGEEINSETKVKTINLYVNDSQFIQKELQSKYAYKILEIWRKYYPDVKSIRIGLKKKVLKKNFKVSS